MCLVVSAGHELHMFSHPKGWPRCLYKIESGLQENKKWSCKASYTLGSTNVISITCIDYTKSGDQPRNKLHISMGRVVIVDAMMYHRDPCSRTKALIPSSFISVGCWCLTNESLLEELPSAKGSYQIPGYTFSPEALQSSDSDFLPQWRTSLKFHSILKKPMWLTKVTLRITLKFKFSLCPILFHPCPHR